MSGIYWFVFHYPLLMAFAQIIGSLIYERHRTSSDSSVEELDEYPLVSILIPCHNEEACIKETIEYLFDIDYPHYEIIAIDDASTDKTLEILRDLQTKDERLRIVNMTSNQGKGTGLTMAAMASKGEYFVCIDADAILDPQAVKYFVWHLHKFPRVGAITGNPRIRNRTSILGKIQVGEFSSIVGMIKRAQRVLGKIFTVSGVIASFKKRALFDVGFWSNDMVTDDIDVSWKLQTRFWDIRYEPRALCWILMPETVVGLWRQRFRWAQGGGEVLRKFGPVLCSWKQRRLWPIYAEYLLSVIWAYSFFLTFFMYGLGFFVDLPENIIVRSITPGWTGLILSLVCLIQLVIGLLVIDKKYEPTDYTILFWLIWYPLVYWILNALVTVFAFPTAMLRKRGQLAIWKSPDRGV